jgi:hypothetical protein
MENSFGQVSQSKTSNQIYDWISVLFHRSGIIGAVGIITNQFFGKVILARQAPLLVNRRTPLTNCSLHADLLPN